MATTGVMAINNALYKNMSYDASTDFECVAFVASITNVVIVAADSPLRSIEDLVAAAKRAPGRLTFASSGAGASTHMSAELFKIMAGVDLLHVPYKGSGPALPDVMTGRVSVMFENMPGAMPHIRAGTLVPLPSRAFGGRARCRKSRPSTSRVCRATSHFRGAALRYRQGRRAT